MIAVLALSAAPADATKHHDGCHPRRARTVAHNATVRVFWVRDTLYTCKKGGTHPIDLGTPALPCSEQSSTSGCDGVGAVRVRRRFVAVAWFAEGDYQTNAWVDVVDVVKRRHVTRWRSPRRDGPHWYTQVTDIVLAPSGAVGMLISDGKAEEGGPFTHKVLTLRAGKRTLLDESDDFPESDGLREGSLRLSRDGTLSWKHGDMTRSAPLR